MLQGRAFPVELSRFAPAFFFVIMILCNSLRPIPVSPSKLQHYRLTLEPRTQFETCLERGAIASKYERSPVFY